MFWDRKGSDNIAGRQMHADFYTAFRQSKHANPNTSPFVYILKLNLI